MPAAKSRNTLPSMSSIAQPSPRTGTIGYARGRLGLVHAWSNSTWARALGPGSSVTMCGTGRACSGVDMGSPSASVTHRCYAECIPRIAERPSGILRGCRRSGARDPPMRRRSPTSSRPRSSTTGAVIFEPDRVRRAAILPALLRRLGPGRDRGWRRPRRAGWRRRDRRRDLVRSRDARPERAGDAGGRLGRGHGHVRDAGRGARARDDRRAGAPARAARAMAPPAARLLRRPARGPGDGHRLAAHRARAPRLPTRPASPATSRRSPSATSRTTGAAAGTSSRRTPSATTSPSTRSCASRRASC